MKVRSVSQVSIQRFSIPEQSSFLAANEEWLTVEGVDLHTHLIGPHCLLGTFVSAMVACTSAANSGSASIQYSISILTDANLVL